MTEPIATHITIDAIDDTASPDALDSRFDAYAAAYKKWMRRAPSRDHARAVDALRKHTPELLPVFDELLSRFGDDDSTARFLTLYEPPPLVRACSQTVLPTSAGPTLLRNYDHAPSLFDGVLLQTDWAGTKTLAMTDCLWGALDGINEHGLCVALAFGGRHAIGPGFAAPLVVRYLLQTCETVADARDALSRVPVYMPYTFVVVDAAGDFVTAFCSPDRETTFVTRRCSANHQAEHHGTTEWPAYARQTQSRERLAVMESLLKSKPDIIRDAFRKPPLWRTDHAKASGTLYSAEYNPRKKRLDLRWPEHTERVTLGKLKACTIHAGLVPELANKD